MKVFCVWRSIDKGLSNRYTVGCEGMIVEREGFDTFCKRCGKKIKAVEE